MSNVTITQLPYAGAITGTESVPIVQNGQTVQTTTAAISASPSQTQTFLTLNQEPTLANSRALAVGTGLGLVDGGAQSTLQVRLNGTAASLESATNGVIVKTGSNTIAARTIQTTGNGIQILNGSGIAGNPTISLTGLVQSLADSSGAGLLAMPNNGTVTPRAIDGTADQISVTNGTGAAGNPTIAIASNPILPGTGSVTVPLGTTGQQPAGSNGQIRYDTTVDAYLGYSAGSWRQFSLAGGVTLINTGTGLTGGPITATGTVSIANTAVTAGSYGSATQVGQFTVNAQGQLTSASNTTITPSGIGAVASVSGTAGEITATGTTNVVLSLPSALTFTGKTVTNGTFNMAAATVGADTVTTNIAAQTLTNKTISGSNNTLSNIANASLTNSQITLGTTNIALGGTALTPAGLTSVTVTQNPVAALDLATKQYVDTLVSSGITYHAPVKYEVPNTTGNLNATYNNGTAGVGATLTNAGALVAFTPDGTVASVADRILIYNQTNQAQNGVYVVTTVGSGSVAWVLTRASDADTYALKSPNALGEGDAFFITSGSSGAGETYVCNTVGTITFGTTAITFAQISASQIYSAGTGLTLTGTQFSISNTAVTAAAYGSASSVPTFTVNAQGQLTLAANASIAINGNQITSGVVAIGNGGSGQITAQLAMNAFAGAVTSGSYLRGDGTNVVMSSIQAADVPTLNQNTTGTASNVTGTVAVANGGTGATTLTGYVKGSGTSPLTASATIPNTDISGLGTMSTQNAGTVAITGGTINGTTIGATTATTGNFTTVTATTGIFGGTF
jgi:hypothetical protein